MEELIYRLRGIGGLVNQINNTDSVYIENMTYQLSKDILDICDKLEEEIKTNKASE